MSNIPKERIPPIPDWRWRLLFGDESQHTEELLQLQRYIEEEGIDISVDDSSEHFSTAVKMRETYPIRRVLEKLMAERCDNKKIRDVIYYRFKMPITIKDINVYRKLFFDVDSISNVDIAKYYEDRPTFSPIPENAPPVPGRWRESYTLYKEGGDAEIDPNDAIKFMLLDSIFRAAELGEYGWRGDGKKIQYHRLALDAYKTLMDANRDGVVDLPEAFRQEIFYPEMTSIDYDQIDYDPNEDPNEQ